MKLVNYIQFKINLLNIFQFYLFKNCDFIASFSKLILIMANKLFDTVWVKIWVYIKSFLTSSSKPKLRMLYSLTRKLLKCDHRIMSRLLRNSVFKLNHLLYLIAMFRYQYGAVASSLSTIRHFVNTIIILNFALHLDSN